MIEQFITGVMSSGKSERLIQEIDNRVNVPHLIIKPSKDTRDGAFIKTRAHDRFHHAVLVDESNPQLVELVINGLGQYVIVFIDEVQFFGKAFMDRLIDECRAKGIRIVASGLSKDYKGEWFEGSRSVWIRTEWMNIVTLYGECHICGGRATVDVLMDVDNNLITDGESVLIEGSDQSTHFDQLCPTCFEVVTS